MPICCGFHQENMLILHVNAIKSSIDFTKKSDQLAFLNIGITSTQYIFMIFVSKYSLNLIFDHLYNIKKRSLQGRAKLMSGDPDTYQREINSYSAEITSYSIGKDLHPDENIPKDCVFLLM